MSTCAVKFKRLPCWVLLALCVTATHAWAGDFAVIVNKDNTAPVDKGTIVKIYSGELKSWKDGSAILAVDLPESNPVRASFATEVLGKTVANIKALWAQMIFSGQALPPKQASSDEEVKKLVSANKGGIGYIKASEVDDSVRVVLK
jgi:ABC-type phosphate transport system substrate-binding protein